jgi:riboflavin biosynthesis pyrimidine reductase
MSSKLPLITNILALSLDGKIATKPHESDGERRQLGFVNEDDFTHLKHLVSKQDAVIIGSRSLQVTKGAFSVKAFSSKEPLWIIASQKKEPLKGHPFLTQDHIPKLHLKITSTPFKVLPSQSLVATLQGPLVESLAYLKAHYGVKKIALLGGSEINTLFWEQNLVHYLECTLSPYLVGNPKAPSLLTHLSSLRRLTLLKVKRKQDFLWLRYKCEN